MTNTLIMMADDHQDVNGGDGDADSGGDDGDIADGAEESNNKVDTFSIKVLNLETKLMFSAN